MMAEEEAEAMRQTDKQRHSSSRQSKAQQRRQEVIARLERMAASILDTTEVNENDVAFLRDSQNFAYHPNLALYYYHLCGTHPDAHVFNDETLRGPEGEAVCQRILNAIGSPIGLNEAIRCTKAANERQPGRITVCASCNEVQLSSDNVAKKINFDNLNDGFVLTSAEKIEIMTTFPEELINQHVSVLKHKDRWYHLNPDLVPKDVLSGKDYLSLCKQCATDPRANGKWYPPFSIAKGHDYGRLGDVPKLNDISMNVIRPVRAYNIDLLVPSNHTTAHAICFPSDGPVQFSKFLPDLPKDTNMHVTFLGPQETWRKSSQRYRGLYTVNVPGIYKWIKLLKDLHHPAFKDIQIDESPEMVERLSDLCRIIEEEATCCNNEDVAAMDAHLQSEQDELPPEERTKNVQMNRIFMMNQKWNLT